MALLYLWLEPPILGPCCIRSYNGPKPGNRGAALLVASPRLRYAIRRRFLALLWLPFLQYVDTLLGYLTGTHVL